MQYADFTLNQWLHYFENRPQQEIQLGLTRIRTVAERLQLLDPTAVVITVAGTNGKGSTVTMLEAIYTEAGYRVGTYTSPHLLYFNERIRLNKHPVSDESICRAFTNIESIRDSIHLTYFEMATLAALLTFKQSNCDVIILEVGLGGRLDATNIIDADLAIITTIDFDHEAYLGNTLEAIGFEKAGILRQNQRAIYADDNMPRSIAQHAHSLNVSLKCLNQDFSYLLNDTHLNISFASGEGIVLPRPNLHANAVTAGIVAARYLAKELPVNAHSLEFAVKNGYLAGRQQVIYDTICTVLDVSHNPQAVKLLVNRVNALRNEKVTGKIHAVFSGLKDKDLCGLISPMCSLVDNWYSAMLDSNRAASLEMLTESFEQAAGEIPHFCQSITEAYTTAKQRAEPDDIIVVYGSFLVVSPIILDNQTREGWG